MSAFSVHELHWHLSSRHRCRSRSGGCDGAEVHGHDKIVTYCGDSDSAGTLRSEGATVLSHNSNRCGDDSATNSHRSNDASVVNGGNRRVGAGISNRLGGDDGEIIRHRDYGLDWNRGFDWVRHFGFSFVEVRGYTLESHFHPYVPVPTPPTE